MVDQDGELVQSCLHGFSDKISTAAYELQLPHTSRTHPIFHVSLLRHTRGVEAPATPPPLPINEDWEMEVEPESILAHRWSKHSGISVLQLLVKWREWRIIELEIDHKVLDDMRVKIVDELNKLDDQNEVDNEKLVVDDCWCEVVLVNRTMRGRMMLRELMRTHIWFVPERDGATLEVRWVAIIPIGCDSSLYAENGVLEGAQIAKYYLLMLQGKEFVAILAGSCPMTCLKILMLKFMSNAALAIEIESGNAENNKLVKEINELKTTLLAAMYVSRIAPEFWIIKTSTK
ncbi:hypothetical protein CTI12_AA217580 [Artemisia annua]|uniref:Uncharacterized protein n=1 Tax=Artemisia annua TaxID=35608 RepID=A0A2U1NXU8_ARTAN|nr:hypothetical protein CTI12_AA217580 [Artemisia annua]